ncbi:MAG: wax ester/triacylglycerol synthase domain-containing protein [Ktedonobacterales bacterium]
MNQRQPMQSALRWLAAGIGFAAASYATYVGISWRRYGHATPSTGDELDALLDRFMPTYEVALRHDTQVAAPAAITFAAASEMDIQQSAIVRALFTGRALLLGGDAEDAVRPRPLLAWMNSLGWTVLADIPGRAVVIGTVTRPWEASPTPRVISPADFAAFQEPGYVKIATTWAAEPLGPDTSRITIGTRVATTDAVASRHFRRYWAVFSPGSLVIRCVALGLIKGQVERQAATRLQAIWPATRSIDVYKRLQPLASNITCHLKTVWTSSSARAKQALGRAENAHPIERLSSTVADPSAPAYIASVMIVEAGPLLDANGRLRLTEIQHRIERRLARLPQLRRRALFPGPLQGRPIWVDAARFAIECHVRQGTVDMPGGEAEILAAAERILRDHLDQSQPPWELWFLTGLSDDHIAVLLKLHHAIADGMGAVQIVMTLFDTAPDAPDPPPAPWTPAPPPFRRALLADNLAIKATMLARTVAALRHPRQLAVLASDLRRSITMGSQAPAISFNRPVPAGSSDQLRVLHLELEPARAAAHAADAKINDVLLDIAAGGLRELLLGRGEQVTGLQVFAMVLVTLRSSAEARALGNHAGFMIVPLPLSEPDGRQRLRLIGASTRKAKAEQHPAYFQVLGALSVLSAKVAPALMERQRYMNLIVTNVPGPTVPLYLFGARILDVIPLLGGFLGGNVTVCFCALSYAGHLNLTAIADAAIIPDVDFILQGMQRTWVELAGRAAALHP